MDHEPQMQILPVRFVGSGSEYFRIWIVNLLLTLITLGFYYPFAKVRRLRYFYGATEVDGHPLSFHADPWKMLRGYVLVALLVGAYSGAGRVSPVAGLVAFLIVGLVWPALWYSSMRFRLANTGWRGLRLRFIGRMGGAYLAMAPGFVLGLSFVGLGLAVQMLAVPSKVPTAGARTVLMILPLLSLVMVLALPALFWLLRRYQHSNLALGEEHTRFETPVSSFYGAALRVFGIGLVTASVGGIAAAVLMAGLRTGAAERGTGSPFSWVGWVVLAVMLLFYQVVIVSAWTAWMQDRVWNGTRSAHLRFQSRLKASSLIGVKALNALLTLITLGLYYPFAAVALARLRLQAVTVLSRVTPESLVADAPEAEAAAGDAAGDFFGLDVGL
jgi:uncharacterized membrane protein YjgN (DUF898 family)